jgi:hypothetical protein
LVKKDLNQKQKLEQEEKEQILISNFLIKF